MLNQNFEKVKLSSNAVESLSTVLKASEDPDLGQLVQARILSHPLHATLTNMHMAFLPIRQALR